MQTTIYYRDEDEYLIEKVEKKGQRERKSKSAVILSILEEYFEGPPEEPEKEGFSDK